MSTPGAWSAASPVHSPGPGPSSVVFVAGGDPEPPDPQVAAPRKGRESPPLGMIIEPVFEKPPHNCHRARPCTQPRGGPGQALFISSTAHSISPWRWAILGTVPNTRSLWPSGAGPIPTLGTLRGRQPLRDSGTRNQKSTFLFKWKRLFLKYLCMYLSFCGPPAPLLWCFAPGKRECRRARGKTQGQRVGAESPPEVGAGEAGEGKRRQRVRGEVSVSLWQGWGIRVPHSPWSPLGAPRAP